MPLGHRSILPMFFQKLSIYYSTSKKKNGPFIDGFPGSSQKSRQFAKITLTTPRKVSIFLFMRMILISQNIEKPVLSQSALCPPRDIAAQRPAAGMFG